MPLFEWPVLQCATVSKGIAKNQTCSGTQFFATFIVVKEEREGRKGTERCDFVTLLFMKGVHSRRTRTPFSAAWTWAASNKVLALSFFPFYRVTSSVLTILCAVWYSLLTLRFNVPLNLAVLVALK